MNTRSMIAIACLLVLLASACGRKTSPTDDAAQPPSAEETVLLTPTQDDSAARTAADQDRIARAFHATIVPQLESCWGQLGGQGGIQFKYTYAREGDDWIFRQVETDGSSLEKGQDAAALQCMQQAASRSTFPLESDEAARNAREMVVHWGWPVPLPEDRTQLARMIVENPPGPECPKICQDCAWRPGQSFCASACSGWTGCVEDGTGTGCRMTRPECRTGWSGSLAGVFMAREAGDVPAPEAGQEGLVAVAGGSR